MLRTSKITEDELLAVNELIVRSKKHWYPQGDYIEEAADVVRIDKEWMKDNEGLCLYIESKLIGFLGFSKYSDYWYLEHLWIEPSDIGSHYGSRALELMKDLAVKENIHKISLLPEPKAEGFYQKNGATYTGIEVPSILEGGPIFNEMILEF